MKRIGVLLSGCGVADGSEIHEAVLTMLAITEEGMHYVCMAPNEPQHQVMNHLTHQAMHDTRNMLIESARIARGDIQDVAHITAEHIDGLVIPGGFGAASNLTEWASHGAQAKIRPHVKRIILEMIDARKPVVGLCMGPTVIALALKDHSNHVRLTIGSTDEASPYNIAAIQDEIAATGQQAVNATLREVVVDPKLPIITAPCYMMEATIADIRKNIQLAIREMVKHLPT